MFVTTIPKCAKSSIIPANVFTLKKLFYGAGSGARNAVLIVNMEGKFFLLIFIFQIVIIL